MSNRISLQHLRADLGLVRCAAFYRDGWFIAAGVLGIVALVLIRILLPGPRNGLGNTEILIVINLLLWSPVLEEILFRGVVQGQLLQTALGMRFRLGLSQANWITSVLFAALHLLHHPPLWAIGTIIPSLLFGHFRDRYASVYPAITLHFIFNLEYLLLLA